MSNYQLGLTVGAARYPERFAYERGLVVGATIATPGYIKAEANSLNTEVRAMDAELGAVRSSWGLTRDADLSPQQRVMDTWWNAAWVPFFREWSSFWELHGNTWGAANWYHNFWGSVYDSIQDFRRRLVDLRQSAEAAGYLFLTPSPTPPKDNPGILESIGEAISAFFGKLLWVVVLVGGFVVLLKLIPSGGYRAVGRLP